MLRPKLIHTVGSCSRSIATIMEQQQNEDPSNHGVENSDHARSITDLELPQEEQQSMDSDDVQQHRSVVMLGETRFGGGSRTPYNSVAQIRVDNDDDDDDDDDDDIVDDTPDFILNRDDVVEVPIDDNDPEPMDEDDDDEADENNEADEGREAPHDMSTAQIQVHTGHVYSVATHYNVATSTLALISGGGDDKAYWHQWLVPGTGTLPQPAVPNTTTSTLLSHVHSDSVSCVAMNLAHLQAVTPPTSVAPSPSTRYLAVGGYDGAIIVYDADTQAKVQEFEGPSDVEWLAFHPKGGTVLLAGSAADGTIWMFHIPLRKCLQVFVGHESGVTAGAFSPDGRWALSTSADGTARIWAPRTGQCQHVFRFSSSNAGLTSLAIQGGTDGQSIMVGSEDGMAHVCHIGTKKVVATLRHYDIPSTSLQQQQQQTNNDDEDEVELPMSVEAVGFCAPSVNPNWCATGGADGVLKIWDLANDGQCRQTCRRSNNSNPNAKSAGITCLRWHTSLPLVFTASSSGVIDVWDARNGRLLHSLTGHTDVINDMDIQCLEEQGRVIVTTASDDKTIRMFDVDIRAALQQQQQQ